MPIPVVAAEAGKGATPSILVDFFWPFKIAEGEEAGRFIEGYCTTTDIDLEDERLTSECLRKVASSLPGSPIFYNHDTDLCIGVVHAARYDDKGLWVKGLISETEDVIWTKIKEKILSKMSVRLRGKEGHWTYENGRKIFEIDDVLIPEVSVTALPCNPAAAIVHAYEKFNSFLEGRKAMSTVNIAQMIKSLQDAIKDLVSQQQQDDPQSWTIPDEVKEKVVSYIRAQGAEAQKLNDQQLQEGLKEIIESIPNLSDEDKGKATQAILDFAKEQLRAQYGYPPPPDQGYYAEQLASIVKRLDDLEKRVAALEGVSKALTEGLPETISKTVGEAMSLSSEELSKGVKAVKDAVEAIKQIVEKEKVTREEQTKSMDGRLKKLEEAFPGRRSDASPIPGSDKSFWKGVFPF